MARHERRGHDQKNVREGAVSGRFPLTVGEILEGLTPETLIEFKALEQRSSYPPDTLLFGVGQPCFGFFWVASGRVVVSMPDDFSESTISHVAQTGELLDLKAALCGDIHSMTARTESPSEVVFVSREHLTAFLCGHADAAFQIVQRLSHRLALTMGELRALTATNLLKATD